MLPVRTSAARSFGSRASADRGWLQECSASPYGDVLWLLFSSCPSPSMRAPACAVRAPEPLACALLHPPSLPRRSTAAHPRRLPDSASRPRAHDPKPLPGTGCRWWCSPGRRRAYSPGARTWPPGTPQSRCCTGMCFVHFPRAVGRLVRIIGGCLVQPNRC